MAGKRNAQGAGTIRKKTVTRKGKEYTYWEARITVGRDPGTGKQIQKSFSGKTQKEVREKMQAAAVAVNTGTYTPPSKLTYTQWLDIWTTEYLVNVKPATFRTYTSFIENHIKPSLGGVKLSDLKPHMIQTFINSLNGLATGSVHLVYRLLHASLEKALTLEYLPKNPIDHCVLPKREQKNINPLKDEEVSAILKAAKGDLLENLFLVALFTGMRISEICGLCWDQIDMQNATILVDRQLSASTHRKKELFTSPKSGKSRLLKTAPSVMVALKDQKRRQAEMQLKAGAVWDNSNSLVFTTPEGKHINQMRATRAFKAILNKAGIDDIRFHDLRHTYAVNAIRAGDDIKTIQGNLGHATAAFTLDKYGHYTDKMRDDSAARMEAFIKSNLNL